MKFNLFVSIFRNARMSSYTFNENIEGERVEGHHLELGSIDFSFLFGIEALGGTCFACTRRVGRCGFFCACYGCECCGSWNMVHFADDSRSCPGRSLIELFWIFKSSTWLQNFHIRSVQVDSRKCGFLVENLIFINLRFKFSTKN